MPALSKEAIQRVVDELQCGLRVFYHKETFDLVFVPDMDLYPEMEEFWQEDLDKLEKYADDYMEIDPMPSSIGFSTMEDFAEQVHDKFLQQKLLDALNRKGPFSNFKFVIDNSGHFRQLWFDFKAIRYMEWVERQLPV